MRISAAILVTCVAVGLAVAQRLPSDPNWKAPPEAAARKNPLEPKEELVAGGRKVFLRECAQCHGERGEGGKRKHAPNLAELQVQQQSDGELFWKITNGNPRRNMPAWAKLPELQRWQLVLFLRTLHEDVPTNKEPGKLAGLRHRVSNYRDFKY
jgi:mono/diheme cytochrome c family protein